MKLTIKNVMVIGTAITALLTSQTAMADIFTYEFSWAGTDHFGSSDGKSAATASATVRVNQPSLSDATMGEVLDISMTVQNAPVGNGVFNKGDFNIFSVQYRHLPDLSESGGQELDAYDIYGVAFLGNGFGAPISFAADRMWAGGVQGGTTLYLASAYVSRTLAAPVPETDTYAMLAAGLGLIGFVSRRRSRMKGTPQE